MSLRTAVVMVIKSRKSQAWTKGQWIGKINDRWHLDSFTNNQWKCLSHTWMQQSYPHAQCNVQSDRDSVLVASWSVAPILWFLWKRLSLALTVPLTCLGYDVFFGEETPYSKQSCVMFTSVGSLFVKSKTTFRVINAKVWSGSYINHFLWQRHFRFW